MHNRPLYLFVCVENTCRSQIAEGLFRFLTDRAVAESAGTLASGIINPMAIEVMADRGVDISSQKSKKLTPDLATRAYRVVTMGCIDSCPYTPPEKTIKWDIPDPKGKEKGFFIKVRDEIEDQIRQLLERENLLNK